MRALLTAGIPLEHDHLYLGSPTSRLDKPDLGTANPKVLQCALRLT